MNDTDLLSRQIAAIERTLRVFHPTPGEVVELRALRIPGRKQAECETFNDLHVMAARAAELDAQGGTGCYFTLNPLADHLAGWKDSRIKASDVLVRHWLPIDCDSDKSRPASSNATYEEKEAGFRVARRCRDVLDGAGLVNPVVGDSGNGYHLCYPVDLPNDEASQKLIKAVLKGLGERCNEEGAAVTPSTHDAPRIWKCYNTRARKGPEEPGRPWRWARLIEGVPWDQAAASANDGALMCLLASWRDEHDLRQGRPQEDGGDPVPGSTPRGREGEGSGSGSPPPVPPDVVERARRYVEAMPPAVSGQGGHDQTFLVAQVLARGFGLARHDSWPILLAYNARCVGPWSEAQLLHKIETAEADSKLPHGYLLGGGPAQAPRSVVGDPTTPPTPTPPPEPVGITICLRDVEVQRVDWLWWGWLPEGELCVLDGDPGLAKSTMTLDLAARLSRGDAFPPFEGKDPGRHPVSTLLLGAEDSLSHTVRPRLDAMGADCSLIHSLEAMTEGKDDRPVILPKDLERMEAFIVEHGVKLVVIDPLMAYLASDCDAHKDQDVRRCLRPLKRLAERLGIVVLLVRHLNKLHGGPALYRGGSSIGITGAARSSLIVGRDPDADRFVLAMNKCNLGPVPTSLAYHVEGCGTACRIVWEGECDLKKDQILAHGSKPRNEPGQRAPRKAGPGRPADALAECRHFLADLLSGGPVLATEVQERADRAELAWRTVARAKADMDVRSIRGSDGVWRWALPPSTINGGALDGLDVEPDATDAEPDGCDNNPFL